MYEPIEGVREFADGRASTIGGLETPDPYTLRVHLTEVTNDLGYRFALPATAPIPPSPTDSSARFGAAEGHDDGYGRFLASSGPYMIEGAQELDPSLPADAQRPVTGLVAGESLTLVRNPSWSRQTDELREAYVDRVEVRVVRLSEAWRAIDDGTLDVIYNGAPSPEQLERYESDPELRDRVFRETCNFVGFVSMRLVAPPSTTSTCDAPPTTRWISTAWPRSRRRTGGVPSVLSDTRRSAMSPLTPRRRPCLPNGIRIRSI